MLAALLIAACGDDDEPVTAGAGDPVGVGGDTIEGRYVAGEPLVFFGGAYRRLAGPKAGP